MKLLCIDTSSQAVSAAICTQDMLLGESYLNIKTTHSETLMVLVQQLLQNTGTRMQEITHLGVSVGPGSFTGLRIGISAVKGMAFSSDLPCIPVSTLESLAYNVRDFRGVILPVLDARRNEVYTAAFLSDEKGITRIMPDTPMPMSELVKFAKNREEPLILVGDGAQMCYTYFLEQSVCAALAPAAVRYQRAGGVAAAALMHTEQAVPAAQLSPSYLRISQAERERMQKQNSEGEK